MFARNKITDAMPQIQSLFQNAQQNQLASINSAANNAMGSADAQANARAAGQGMGASSINGAGSYVLNTLLPSMMQQTSNIYGQGAQMQGSAMEQLLAMLNQNAGMSGRSTSQGGLGSTGFSTAGACWVAEELYGSGDIRTIAARRYCRTHDNWFTRLYTKHGIAWAAWLKAHAWAKPIVEPIWYWMAKTALREYCQRKAV
jgi:hypothetical protein